MFSKTITKSFSLKTVSLLRRPIQAVNDVPLSAVILLGTPNIENEFEITRNAETVVVSAVASANGNPVSTSTIVNTYLFPIFDTGNGPKKSIIHSRNILLIGERPSNLYKGNLGANS
ncbi:hypothetical protein AYI69_g9545 [Smittium culicis]|uniref:Uncharacterized protein n=1 Tax=Smittium culicis TaxID=133412 RepID=A0A1R1XBW9_9FUNG|nr:hypothetical protein AYI69_g9545 [Smittium culicis]